MLDKIQIYLRENDETLVSFLPVLDKQKKRYIVLSKKRNGKAKISKLKQEDLQMSQAKQWNLDELKSVENIDVISLYNIQPKSFSLFLNKQYFWEVEEPKKKIEFLIQLLKLTEGLKKLPKLIRVTEEVLQEELQTYENRERLINSNEIQEEMYTEGRKINFEKTMLKVQGELNIFEVLTDFDWKVGGDATAMKERLLNELAALEAANVHAIIQSEEEAQSLMLMLEEGVKELDMIDGWLSLYHRELLNMGKDILQIEQQNKGLQVQTLNQEALLHELEKIINSLQLSDSVVDTLRNESLETSIGLNRLENACKQLQKAMQTKLDDELMDLKAVQERLSLFGKYAQDFSTRLLTHLSNFLQQQIEIYESQNEEMVPGKILTWQSHQAIYEQLFQYRSLIFWLKEIDPRKHTDLQAIYVNQIQKLFKKEFNDYVDNLKNYYIRKSNDDVTYTFNSGHSKTTLGVLNPLGSHLSPSKASSMVSLLKGHKKTPSSVTDDDSHSIYERSSPEKKKKSKLGISTGGDSQNHFEFSVPEEEKMTPVEALVKILNHILELIVKEQNVIIDLFGLLNCKPMDYPLSKLIPELNQKREWQNKDLKFSKKIEELLGVIFDSIHLDLLSQFEPYLRQDLTLAFGFVHVLEQQLKSAKSQNVAYLTNQWQQLYDRLLSVNDRFFDDQLKAIDDTKITLKKRSGILPFIKILPFFVKRMESFMVGSSGESDSRTLLNSMFERCFKIIFVNLEFLSKETGTAPATADSTDDKEQLNAYIIKLENMHYLYHELRGLKIPYLDSFMKQAKQQYDAQMQFYIKNVVRKPILKLLEFFEGIQTLLKTKSPEEVGFHLGYNKQALQKTIQLFPGKEVKKGLEVLYKRVEKHFSEASGLLQVIWRGIQEEFIRMHQLFEVLIQQCFPESEIHLLFSVDDLCQFFSDIARQH